MYRVDLVLDLDREYVLRCLQQILDVDRFCFEGGEKEEVLGSGSL